MGAGGVVSECAVATKKHPRKKLLATLRESLEAGTPVQVQRSMEPEEVLEGVVLELSDEWVCWPACARAPTSTATTPCA